MKKIIMKKGFTLLETLIAIAIMTVAVGSAFSMAQKSLQTSYQIKNQTTAYFLAAEGLELVRNIRDNATLYGQRNPGSPISWIASLNTNTSCGLGCDINPLGDFSSFSSIGSAIGTCTFGGCKLYIVSPSVGKVIYSSFYDPSSSAQESIFSRSIIVSFPSGSGFFFDKEVLVKSSVMWQGNTASLTETLSDWQNHDN